MKAPSCYGVLEEEGLKHKKTEKKGKV